MSAKTASLFYVYIISFLDLFAVGLTVPLLSNHLRDLGASYFLIGLLTSLYSGLQVVSGPIVGAWSDVTGRKTVLKVTLLICSFSYLILGLTESLFLIAILRFFLGTTKHTQSLCKAIITDILPPEKRPGAFGRSTAFSSLGFIIGPTLGGHLSELQNGFFFICLLTSFVFIVNTSGVQYFFILSHLKSVFSLVIIDEKPIEKGGFLGNFRNEIARAFTELNTIEWRKMWDIFLIRFFFGLAVTTFFSQQGTYLKEHFHLSQKYIGYVISFFSTVGMISAFSLHHINNYYKSDEACHQRLVHFFVLMSLSCIVIFLAPSLYVYLLFLVPFAISSSVLRIVSMEVMLEKAEKNQRGSLSGASNSIMSVARFVTPVCVGVLSDRFGGDLGMAFAGVPAILGAGVAGWMKWKGKVKGE